MVINIKLNLLLWGKKSHLIIKKLMLIKIGLDTYLYLLINKKLCIMKLKNIYFEYIFLYYHKSYFYIYS